MLDLLNSLAVSFDLPILEWIQANLQSGLLDDIETPVPQKVTRKVFTFAEVSALFNRKTPIDCAVLSAIYSGMRPGELLALDSTHIDLGSGCFRIPGSKTKSGQNRVCIRILRHRRADQAARRPRKRQGEQRAQDLDDVYVPCLVQALLYRFYSADL